MLEMKGNKVMKNNRVAYLRWWLLFALTLFGVSCLIRYDMFSIINAGDVTKISFVIFAVFMFFTFCIGWETHYLYCGKSPDSERIDLCYFVAEQLLTLGLIGTVIGFIYMLSTTFIGIDPSKAISLKSAVVNMSVGMSTALYTTVSGLVCGLLLKIQLINIDYSEKSDDT